MRAAGLWRWLGQHRRHQGEVRRRAAGYCGTVGEFREVVLPWAARELEGGWGTLLIFRGEKPAAFFDFPPPQGGRGRLLGDLRWGRAGGRPKS